MAVLTLAEYATLSFGAETKNTDEIFHRVFDPPDGFVKGTNFARPILFFAVRPSGSSNVVVRVGKMVNGRLNGDDRVCNFRIGTGDNDDEQWRTLHCVINGNEFDGRTDIHIIPVTGRIEIRDVFLLFQFKFET